MYMRMEHKNTYYTGRLFYSLNVMVIQLNAMVQLYIILLKLSKLHPKFTHLLQLHLHLLR